MIENDDKCKRCKHPASWHRHGDEECLLKHPQPCSPEIAPFRCLGYDCERPGFPGGTPETRCGCPDFVKGRRERAMADNYAIALQTLRSIAANACCTPCREAGLFASVALKKMGEPLLALSSARVDPSH